MMRDIRRRSPRRAEPFGEERQRAFAGIEDAHVGAVARDALGLLPRETAFGVHRDATVDHRRIAICS